MEWSWQLESLDNGHKTIMDWKSKSEKKTVQHVASSMWQQNEDKGCTAGANMNKQKQASAT